MNGGEKEGDCERERERQIAFVGETWKRDCEWEKRKIDRLRERERESERKEH